MSSVVAAAAAGGAATGAVDACDEDSGETDGGEMRWTAVAVAERPAATDCRMNCTLRMMRMTLMT